MSETFRRDLGLTLRCVLPAEGREPDIDLAVDAPPSPFLSDGALDRRAVLRAELDFAVPLPLGFREEAEELEDAGDFDFRRSRR